MYLTLTLSLTTTTTTTNNIFPRPALKWNYTHLLKGPLTGTTWVSQYQKGKTNLNLLEQEAVSGSGISWAICKSVPRPDR